jgi:hypothetical protein
VFAEQVLANTPGDDSGHIGSVADEFLAATVFLSLGLFDKLSSDKRVPLELHLTFLFVYSTSLLPGRGEGRQKGNSESEHASWVFVKVFHNSGHIEPPDSVLGRHRTLPGRCGIAIAWFILIVNHKPGAWKCHSS